MNTLVRGSVANVRRLFTYDIVYASFWLTVAVIIFFFPVMLGWQSLTEAVPTFYSHSTPNPSIKTPWQVDGGFHTVDVIPLIKAEIQAIKARVSPLWGLYSGGGGSPLVSNAVNIYYPLRLIFFSIWDSVRAFDWYFLLRFLIAGLGMFMYLRIIGLRRIVSLWGGIAYAFTGYLILYLTYPFLDIDSVLPWALWAIERYFQDQNVRSSATIGFFIAMIILIGQPQSTIIATLLIALYYVWKAIADNNVRTTVSTFARPVRALVSSGARHASVTITVAILIALPFIIDFLITYQQGGTIDDWQIKGLTHFPPIQLLHFLVAPSMMPEVAASGHLFDRYEFIIPYVGLSVLILFFVSFFLKKKPFPLAPLYAWIAFVILKNVGFPLVQWIGKLPIFNQIGWYKAYGPMAAAIVICAAIAFEHILRGQKEGVVIRWRGFYRLLSAIPIVFIATYTFAQNVFLKAYVPNFDFFNRRPEAIGKVAALFRNWPSQIQEFILGIMKGNGNYLAAALFAEAILFGGLALAVIFFLRHERYRRRAAVAMVCLTAFELWFYMPKVRDGFHYLDPYTQTPPYVGFLQGKLEKERVSRTFSLGEVFRGHLGELYDIQKAQDNSSIKSNRYLLFLPEMILREYPLTGYWPANRLSEIPQKFFDAFNIRYLISENPLDPKLGFQLVYDNDLKIYENNQVLPKAYVTFQKQTVASPEEARSLFYGPSFSPHTEVILEDRNAVSLPPATATLSIRQATVVRYKPNEIVLNTETDRDGVLVLTDTFYPNWNAYLDGKRVPVYPANVMFRGIFLPRGSHEIRFAYEPWWFWPSVTISLLTLIGIGIFTVRRARRISSKESTPTESRPKLTSEAQ